MIKTKPATDAFREGFDRIFKKPLAHTLWKDGDKNIPKAILDRNGDVVLGLCKVCGKGESELVEPCVEQVCQGIEIAPGVYSGCDASAGDCPECGK